ncbi:MAG: hypothetical protein KF773_07045 [Deltaproteobacteria bacterium]|nr:hypothetical protein [Deltaproteobacteria bacterium]
MAVAGATKLMQRSSGQEARRLDAAYRELRAARMAFARASVREKRPTSRHPGAGILAAVRKRLLTHPDVVGVGLGQRWRGGALDGEPVIRVYVRRKRPLGQVAPSRVLRTLRHGKRKIGVDVVAFGEHLVAQAAPGDSIGQVSPRSRGTIGTFATTDDGRRVAITAMHVTGARDVTANDSPIVCSIPSRFDDAGAAGLHLDLGTQSGVDAARILLPPGFSIDMRLPTFGDVKGWRWTVDEDVNHSVTLVGATSGRLDGRIIDPSHDFPDLELNQVIVVRIPTDLGDSGASIVDGAGLVLGFLVGFGDGMPEDHRLFCPAGLVLGQLHCSIP